MNRRVIFIIIFLLFLPLVFVLISKSLTGKSDNIISTIITSLTGSSTQTLQDSYKINGVDTVFIYRTDFSFSIPHFQHSQALQQFLKESKFNFKRFVPVGANAPIPKTIDFLLTDKSFKETEWIAYDSNGKQAYSYDYSYNAKTDTLHITVSFNKQGWDTAGSVANSRVPPQSKKLIIGREILWSLAQLDSAYPSRNYADRIYKYVNADTYDLLL